MIEIEAFRPAHRGPFIDLWNDVFRGYRHFRPLDRVRFRDVFERAPEAFPFDPGLLRLATIEGRAIGFVHGGVWRGEIVERLRPGGGTDGLGYMSMIAVAEEWRHRGIGQALLRSLRDEIAAAQVYEVVADGRMLNPFYGNFLAPAAPLWGTTEGAAVPASQKGAQRFLEAAGFRRGHRARSLSLDLARWTPTAPPDGVELVTARDYQAVLGTDHGHSFPLPNESRSWVLADGVTQVASLIAYPFTRDSSSDRSSPRSASAAHSAPLWGIYSLEVDAAARGRGLGPAVLGAAIAGMRDAGARVVETLVLPDEAPAAEGLYVKAGFEPATEWWVFE